MRPLWMTGNTYVTFHLPIYAKKVILLSPLKKHSGKLFHKHWIILFLCCDSKWHNLKKLQESQTSFLGLCCETEPDEAKFITSFDKHSTTHCVLIDCVLSGSIQHRFLAHTFNDLKTTSFQPNSWFESQNSSLITIQGLLRLSSKVHLVC